MMVANAYCIKRVLHRSVLICLPDDCWAHAQRASAEWRVLLCVGGLLFVQSVCRVIRTCAFRADANKCFWYIPVQALFA